jgi:hypothetical protein
MTHCAIHRQIEIWRGTGASVADSAADFRVKDAMIVWLLPVAALAQSAFDGIRIA